MKDPELIRSEFVARPTLESEDECGVGAASEDRRQEEDDDQENKQNEECKVPASFLEVRIPPPSLGEEFKVEDHDDDDDGDGFRTPTSMDHKIPVPKQCPPAPRKPKSCSMRKRKSYSSSNVCHVRIDLSRELEFLFPPLDSDPGHKMKKSRCCDSTTTK